MDLPVAVVDVDRVLEQRRRLGQGHVVRPVELLLEVGEVALHLGDETVTPPIGEMLAVHGQHRVQVGAHVLGERGVLRDARLVARRVLGALDVEVGLGGDGGRVDVAVDVLGQPVDRERGAEPAEHVVAAQPPAADVEEHRADRMRDVQVVVDPEEVLLGLRVPPDRERSVPQELTEDLLPHRHSLLLRPTCRG